MSVNIHSLPGFKFSVGIGYIALPSDLDRATYIKDCYTNNQVSILLEDGGFENRVPLSNEILNFITFPLDAKSLGTPVVYITEELHQKPVIITSLQARDQLGDLTENQFKFKRTLGASVVELSGSTQDNVLNLIINSGEKSGQINVQLFNENENGLFSVDIAGDIDIKSTGKTSFLQQELFEIVTEDKDLSSEDFSMMRQTTTEHQFYNKKLIVNDGTNPFVKGNEMVSLLTDILEAISQITVPTAIGLQPIVNKPTFLALKEELNKIKSEVVFVNQ